MAKTKEEYWNDLAERNGWKNEEGKVVIKVGTLKTLLERTYAEGEAFVREGELKKQKKMENLLGDLFKPKDGGGPAGPIIGGK